MLEVLFTLQRAVCQTLYYHYFYIPCPRFSNMKIITLHCDYIRYQAVKKALKDAETLSDTDLHEIKEPLVVLTSIEQGDGEETIKQLISAVEKTAGEVKASHIVLYPYAH